MRRSWAPVIVGVFVVAVVALTYFLIRAVSERSSGTKGYAVFGLFQDASGLFEKSRVQTAGISIGQIDKRELDVKTKRAKITIRILPHIKLYENAAVTKKSASLLGEYFLEIDPGSPEGMVKGELKQMRELVNGDQIMKVYEPTPIGAVMADVGTLLPILRDILEDVRKLTGGTITNIAENVNTLIETNSEVLERLLNRVDHIAANVESITTSEADDVKQSIKNVREITESIKSLIGTTHGQVAETGGAVKGSIEKLQTTITSLDKTMKNMETISDRLEKGQGTAGRLLTDDTIARNVEEITEDAGGFVRSITRLQTIVGLRSEYNFLSSTFKNYLSIQIMPRPDKFYLIELVEDPRGYRSSTLVYTNSSTTGPMSEERVTITDQLRFSLMLGKRVGPLAGRFGIKESTGGLGADLYLFKDRLVLSADLYDARTNQRPRIKGTALYAVWNRNLYLVGGIDDLANFTRPALGAGGGIDWFLGGQLTFNDEDLKALLLFGGGFIAGASSAK